MTQRGIDVKFALLNNVTINNTGGQNFKGGMGRHGQDGADVGSGGGGGGPGVEMSQADNHSSAERIEGQSSNSASEGIDVLDIAVPLLRRIIR